MTKTIAKKYLPEGVVKKAISEIVTGNFYKARETLFDLIDENKDIWLEDEKRWIGAEITELSQNTLGKYTRKAIDSISDMADDEHEHWKSSVEHRRTSSPYHLEKADHHQKQALKIWDKRERRKNFAKLASYKMEEETEQEELDEARFKIVPIRIRRGKIQRRKKVSTVKNFTFRKGRLTRIPPKEHRKRVISQRRGKIKRKSKMNRSLLKRKRSMRRLKSLKGGKR